MGLTWSKKDSFFHKENFITTHAKERNTEQTAQGYCGISIAGIFQEALRRIPV